MSLATRLPQRDQFGGRADDHLYLDLCCRRAGGFGDGPFNVPAVRPAASTSQVPTTAGGLKSAGPRLGHGVVFEQHTGRVIAFGGQ